MRISHCLVIMGEDSEISISSSDASEQVFTHNTVLNVDTLPPELIEALRKAVYGYWPLKRS